MLAVMKTATGLVIGDRPGNGAPTSASITAFRSRRRFATRPGHLWRRAALVAIACVGLWHLLAITSAETCHAKQWVIPPGQEDLLADMLGRNAQLPGGCQFTGGEASGPIVTGTYTCAGANVAIELHHPDDAPSDAPRTERFAVVVGNGAPPPALVDAVVSLIRAKEASFQWLETKSQPESASPDRSARLVAGGTVLAVLVALWILWRLVRPRRTRGAPEP
jgi:hypothetical protein